METNMMLKTLTAALLTGVVAIGAVLPALGAKKWTIGTPIVTYWAGPGAGFMPVNDETAAQLRAGGWNVGWADTPGDLNTYHRHGVRAMLVIRTPNLDDPDKAKKLEALIEQVRDHPAMYAYYLVDEPGAGAFPMLGRLVEFLRKRDPSHLAFINLFPTYANAAQLNVSDDAAARAKVGYPTDFAGINTDDGTSMRYREHVRQFIEIVKPRLISYDHYHFLKERDGGQYFLNLALIRKAALKAGLPFQNIIQACDSPAEGWRGPGEHEIRWLTYTSVAYGAQAIAHFRYDIGFWTNPKDPATLRPLFWAVSQTNREFVAIASELQRLRSLGAYHFGTLPLGGEAPPETAPFAPSPRKQEILLGYFGRSAGRPTHVVIVNLNYKQPVTAKLAGPGPMQVFHAATGAWSDPSNGALVEIALPPGGGTLVRLAR